MKTRIVLGLFVFILLLLNYAALDDITTGNQDSYFSEYAMLIMSGICIF